MKRLHTIIVFRCKDAKVSLVVVILACIIGVETNALGQFKPDTVAKLTTVVPVQSLEANQTPSTPLIYSGNLSLGTKYTMGSTPNYGYTLPPLDYSSSSYMSMQYGSLRFNATTWRAGQTFRYGQPDKNYTLELALPWAAVRYGDLMPQFTNNTTGYARIAGLQGTLKPFRWLELNSISGLSKEAMSPEGYMPGNYTQTFTAHRMRLRPVSEFELGVSVVKMKDDIGSVDMSKAYAPPTAKENLLLGSDATYYFMNHRASLMVEYASSAFTNDLSARNTGRTTESDSKLSDFVAGNGKVSQFTTVNDSTRIGDVIGAKLLLPLENSNFTVEYRRASRSFMSLANPYDYSDNERYRINNYSSFFEHKVTLMSNVEYSRFNLSGIDPLKTNQWNFYSTASYGFSETQRYSLGYREYQRSNNAEAPTGTQYDLRVSQFQRTVNGSISQDVNLFEKAFTLTGVLSRNWSGDHNFSNRSMNNTSADISAETGTASDVILNTEVGYTISNLAYNGSRQTNWRILAKQGYRFGTTLELTVGEGVTLGRSSDELSKSDMLVGEIAARWNFDQKTSIELQWQSNNYKDFVYQQYGYANGIFELKVNYGF